MAKINLTADRVESFACPAGKKQAFLWDSGMPGLGVRATAGGTRAFIFQGELQGRTVRITLGDVRALTLKAARERTATLRLQVGAKTDPRELERQRIADAQAAKAAELAAVEQARAEAARQTVTVREAWDAYLRYQADKMAQPHIRRKWGERHMAEHHKLADPGRKRVRGDGLTKPGVLFGLMGMRLAEVTAVTLKDWMRAEAAGRPAAVRLGFDMFRAFWRWCAGRAEFAALVDQAAVTSKELVDEKPTNNTKRHDCLPKASLAAWFKAVRNLSSPVSAAYLQALILTGARREEMARLRWEHVNFTANSLWLHDKVDPEGRVIPLTPYLRGLLLGLHRINNTPPAPVRILHGKRLPVDVEAWRPSPWVFFSKTAKGGRMQEPRLPHQRALKAAGLDSVTIHGLRRTYASLAEWTETPTGVVAQIMGHKPSATAERHYKHRPVELLAVWASKYEAFILGEAGLKVEHAGPGLSAVDQGASTAA